MSTITLVRFDQTLDDCTQTKNVLRWYDDTPQTCRKYQWKFGTVPKVTTQWNRGTTRGSNPGPRVWIPSALTTEPHNTGTNGKQNCLGWRLQVERMCTCWEREEAPWLAGTWRDMRVWRASRRPVPYTSARTASTGRTWADASSQCEPEVWTHEPDPVTRTHKPRSHYALLRDCSTQWHESPHVSANNLSNIQWFFPTLFADIGPILCSKLIATKWSLNIPVTL